MLETKQKFEDTVPTYKLSSVVLIRFYWLGKSFGLSKSLVIMDFMSHLVEDQLGVTHDCQVKHATLQCSFHSHNKRGVFSHMD
jgi:hypothetical protein